MLSGASSFSLMLTANITPGGFLSICLSPSSVPHHVQAGTSLRHTHSINISQTSQTGHRSPAPRPAPQRHCQLPAANSPSCDSCQTCSVPRSIIHRHFGVKVPLLSIMGHLLDAKWSFVEWQSGQQSVYATWLETSSRTWTAICLIPIITNLGGQGGVDSAFLALRCRAPSPHPLSLKHPFPLFRVCINKPGYLV